MYKKFTVALMAAMLLSGCGTRPDETEHVLKVQGFHDIEITGYRFFGCGDHDTFRTGFSATSITGEHVTGVACSGMFSGTHIKID